MVACPIVAKAKGRDTWGWFFLGAFFGIFAFIILLCLPSRQSYRYLTEDDYRPRPAPAPVTVNINLGAAGADPDEKRYSANDVAQMMNALTQSGAPAPAGTALKSVNQRVCKYGCGRPGADIKSLDGSYYHRECHIAAYRDGRV